MRILWIWPDWRFSYGNAMIYRCRHALSIGPVVIYWGRASDAEYKAFWAERHAWAKELIDSIERED